MIASRIFPLAAGLGLWLCSAFPLSAMTLNLAKEYDPSYAAPRSQDMVFYYPFCESALLTKPEEAVLRVRTVHEKALKVHWILCRNMVSAPLLEGELDALLNTGWELKLPVDKLSPGFYDLRVEFTDREGKKVVGSSTFGWKADEESLVEDRPADFEREWRARVAEIRKTPLDLKYEFIEMLEGKQIEEYNVKKAGLPPSYDPEGEKFDKIEVYKVSFASPNGGRVYGWFTKPAGDGPFPGLLVLPGAGNTMRPAPLEQARHGWAALDLQIHGHPVDLPVYPDNNYPVDGSWKQQGYGRIYGNALLGVDALASLPGVDAKRLAVCGASQGGQLSLVVAALDPRIRAAVAGITHRAYVPYLSWVKQCNGNKDNGAAGPMGFKDPRSTDAWFDVLNFAPLVECPVFMNVGLIDPVSPATTVHAAFKKLNGPKQLIALPGMGHDWSPQFDRLAWRWLEKTMADSDAKGGH